MSTLSILLSILCSVIGLFLFEATVKLETLNRAWLRKLKDKDRDTAEKLHDYLPQLPQILTCCRVLLLLSCAVAISAWYTWFTLTSGVVCWVRWLIIVASFIIGVMAIEVTEMMLTLRGSAVIIRIAIKLYCFMRWPLAIILEPLRILAAHCQRDAEDDDSAFVTEENEILSIVQDDTIVLPQGNVSAATINNLESDERRMLNGVMTLDKTLVHEVMTPRVDISAISDKCSIAEAKQAIAKSGHSRIPVYKDSIDTITGVLYAKDLLDDKLYQQGKTVSEMLHQPVFVPESKNVAELLNDFRHRRIHIAIVLDEYGGTAGVVTIEDVLEEIVGEIHDEFDHEEHTQENPIKQPDGAVIADARMPICEVNQSLMLELSEEEGYDTIGGYIMARLGRIPRSGEHVETDVLSIDIISASPRRLNTVKLKKHDTSRADA